jgi:hypothetical protein
MKTDSLPTQKASPELNSMAEAEIFSTLRLLLTQKSLRKTESLSTQKSSPEPTSTAEVETFSAPRLLLTHKSLTK